MEITPDSIETLVPELYRDLVFRFFLVFSRFEYALKRAGFADCSRGGVYPAWNSFSSRYHSVFDPFKTPDLRSACDYFTAKPPRKQIIDSGSLGWSEPQFRGNEPLLTWLLLMVRSARNNLFHGGKFPIAPIDEPARNPELLQHALTIICACLPPDAKVSQHFFSNEQ